MRIAECGLRIEWAKSMEQPPARRAYAPEREHCVKNSVKKRRKREKLKIEALYSKEYISGYTTSRVAPHSAMHRYIVFSLQHFYTGVYHQVSLLKILG